MHFFDAQIPFFFSFSSSNSTKILEEKKLIEKLKLISSFFFLSTLTRFSCCCCRRWLCLKRLNLLHGSSSSCLSFNWTKPFLPKTRYTWSAGGKEGEREGTRKITISNFNLRWFSLQSTCERVRSSCTTNNHYQIEEKREREKSEDKRPVHWKVQLQ